MGAGVAVGFGVAFGFVLGAFGVVVMVTLTLTTLMLPHVEGAAGVGTGATWTACGPDGEGQAGGQAR